ncbi:MAG: TIGR03663 family protein [Halobacteriales archaeon]|nr:TIGR03663 family protein [Halobacteriales archaeon]
MSVSGRLGRADRPLLALLAITAVGLVARLAFLGARIAHWDEGRVGYDILRYAATGAWEYRPIVHGPFLPHVNRLVFEWLGPTDGSARLVVAVVGALLPLSAWLYREHLRDVELVALGALLAADPILLYYSRFMRNDVLLATFAFAALGFYVRAIDTGRRRHLFAGTALLALAFTTKENAIVYVLSVLGALVLLFDHRLFLARGREEDWTVVARRRLGRTARALWRWRLALGVALVEFLAILVFFYAPREAAEGGLGLWAAFANPSTLPDVIAAATYNPAPCGGAGADPYCNGAWERVANLWVGGPHQDHAYLPFLGHYVRVLATASGALALLAVLGFLHDRYAGDRPRDLVALTFYWGAVSVLGYPVAVDIKAAWAVVHAVVPLAVPAAVAIGLVVDWGREAAADDDRVGVALAAVVLLLVGGQIGATAVTGVYLEPQAEDNVLTQYAQPAGDLREALTLVGVAAADNDGLDVVWYGEHFLVENESAARRLPVGDGEWYNRLPLPWYLEVSGAERTSTDSPETLERLLADERPPVIITRDTEAAALAGELDGYREFRGKGRLTGLELVIYVDAEYAGDRGEAASSILN